MPSLMLKRWRRIPALYLLALFAAATAAPHHHLNSIADLVSDGPSNSGTIAMIVSPASHGVGFYPVDLVEDESCLACFHSDFAASPALAITLNPSLRPLAERPVAPTLSTLAPVPSDTPSRAPPVLA
jgi:hypothetical protein